MGIHPSASLGSQFRTPFGFSFYRNNMESFWNALALALSKKSEKNYGNYDCTVWVGALEHGVYGKKVMNWPDGTRTLEYVWEGQQSSVTYSGIEFVFTDDMFPWWVMLIAFVVLSPLCAYGMIHCYSIIKK